MAKMIEIENKQGERYAVLPRDFEKGRDDTYKGFKSIAYEDGEPYPPPAARPAPKADERPAPKTDVRPAPKTAEKTA